MNKTQFTDNVENLFQNAILGNSTLPVCEGAQEYDAHCQINRRDDTSVIVRIDGQAFLIQVKSLHGLGS